MSGTVAHRTSFDLSLIIITRNSLEVLPRCIGALQPLVLQGELRIQSVVIDMDSTDGTKEYLSEEREKWHISDFVSAPFETRFDAMNHGLSMVQGRVCLFITPETELMVENTAACCAPILRGEVECVFSSAVQVNPDNGNHRPKTPNTDHLFLRPLCSVEAFFCSARLLKHLGGFNRHLYPELAEVDLMHRALETGVPYRVTSLSSCRQYECATREENEALHADFLRFIAAHKEEILMQCKAHPSYAVRTVHEILRHAVRCAWPVADETFRVLDDLLCGLSRVIRPIIRRKIVRRLRRRALIQALLIPFKGLRRACITRKLVRSHFHVARLLETENV